MTKTIVRSGDPSTACSASALARKKRARPWSDAPSAKKNTNRSAPVRSAA